MAETFPLVRRREQRGCGERLNHCEEGVGVSLAISSRIRSAAHRYEESARIVRTESRIVSGVRSGYLITRATPSAAQRWAPRNRSDREERSRSIARPRQRELVERDRLPVRAHRRRRVPRAQRVLRRELVETATGRVVRNGAPSSSTPTIARWSSTRRGGDTASSTAARIRSCDRRRGSRRRPARRHRGIHAGRLRHFEALECGERHALAVHGDHVERAARVRAERNRPRERRVADRGRYAPGAASDSATRKGLPPVAA
jgi:hypothetical protein